MNDVRTDDSAAMPTVKEYPQREIFAYGRYVQCQILNWDDGPPPRYLVCNPLDRNYREPFLARQGLGTWMRVELRDALREIDGLMLALVDKCWNHVTESTAVPSRTISRKLIQDARATPNDLVHATTV